eukprot:scaffold243172_cov21-Tisochrysis_lutea.AAC.2
MQHTVAFLALAHPHTSGTALLRSTLVFVHVRDTEQCSMPTPAQRCSALPVEINSTLTIVQGWHCNAP